MSTAFVFDTISKRLVPHGTEEQIHRAVVHMLQAFAVPGVYWFHPANGEARSKAAGGRLKAMGVKAGMPDLCLTYHGCAYYLELKTPTGHLSPAQKLAHLDIAASGAALAVAYGVDDALAQLTAWGLLRPMTVTGGQS